MAAVYRVILLAAFCVTYAAAKCDKKVISAIASQRGNVDDSNILQTLDGEYAVIYLQAGKFNTLFSSECLSGTYQHNPWGVNLIYKGVSEGTFNATFKGGAIQVENKKGVLQWQVYVIQHNGDVITLYTCSDKPLFDFEVYSVGVLSSSYDSSDDALLEGKQALEKLGVKNIVEPPICL